jgi:ribonucleotide monophosphatase NagD (HAD superfamily)
VKSYEIIKRGMRRFEGYIFDLDGTIYLGKRAITGAPETVRCLREAG